MINKIFICKLVLTSQNIAKLMFSFKCTTVFKQFK